MRHAVGEVELGTPLRTIIETIGGGARPGRRVVAVLSGVANAIVPAALLDTPASYESMAAIGSGLGASGFWAEAMVFPIKSIKLRVFSQP